MRQKKENQIVKKPVTKNWASKEDDADYSGKGTVTGKKITKENRGR